MRAAARAAGVSQPGPGASDTRSANSRPSSEYLQVSSPRSPSAANPSYRKTWPRAGGAPSKASGEFIASESTEVANPPRSRGGPGLTRPVRADSCARPQSDLLKIVVSPAFRCLYSPHGHDRTRVPTDRRAVRPEGGDRGVPGRPGD